MPQVTIVFPARNEGTLLPATLRSLASVPAGADFDVVVVDDGSHPPADVAGDLGLALRLVRTAGEGAPGARNRGAALARAPALCFCDAHLEYSAGWLGALLARLRHVDAVSPGICAMGRPDLAGYGFTWSERYEVRWLPRPPQAAEVPFLPGGCLLVRRAAFQAVGGFDPGLAPWGYEDVELSWTLWLAGFRCGVEPGVLIGHHFRPRHPYPVFQPQVDRNLLRIGCVHFGPARLQRLIRHLAPDAGTLAAVQTRARPRRAALAPGRRQTDDWLCARFQLPI